MSGLDDALAVQYYQRYCVGSAWAGAISLTRTPTSHRSTRR